MGVRVSTHAKDNKSNEKDVKEISREAEQTAETVVQTATAVANAFIAALGDEHDKEEEDEGEEGEQADQENEAGDKRQQQQQQQRGQQQATTAKDQQPSEQGQAQPNQATDAAPADAPTRLIRGVKWHASAAGHEQAASTGAPASASGTAAGTPPAAPDAAAAVATTPGAAAAAAAAPGETIEAQSPAAGSSAAEVPPAAASSDEQRAAAGAGAEATAAGAAAPSAPPVPPTAGTSASSAASAVPLTAAAAAASSPSQTSLELASPQNAHSSRPQEAQPGQDTRPGQDMQQLPQEAPVGTALPEASPQLPAGALAAAPSPEEVEAAAPPQAAAAAAAQPSAPGAPAAAASAPATAAAAAAAPRTCTPSDSSACGVSLAFLQWFADYVEGGLTTRQVVEAIIEVQTEDSRDAYVKLLDGPDVGPPSLYAIHSWDRPFKKMVQALVSTVLRSYPGTPPDSIHVYIDIFAHNMHGPPLQEADLLNLQNTMSGCAMAAVCLDHHGAALGRAWVLWETWLAACCLGPDRLLMVSGLITDSRELAKRVRGIDLATSTTHHPHDHQLLLDAVQASGHAEGFEAQVRSALLAAARTMVAAAEPAALAAAEVTGGDGDARAALAAAMHRCGAVMEGCGLAQDAREMFAAAAQEAAAAAAAAAAPDPTGSSSGRAGGSSALLAPVCLQGAAAAAAAGGDLAAAEAAYRQALAAERQAHNTPHPAVGKTSMQLAVVLRRSGKLEEAEQLYRQALQIFEQDPRGGAIAAYNAGLAHIGLSHVLKRCGRRAEALQAAQAGESLLTSALGPGHVKVAEAGRAVAELAPAAGQP